MVFVLPIKRYLTAFDWILDCPHWKIMSLFGSEYSLLLKALLVDSLNLFIYVRLNVHLYNYESN